MTQQSHRALAIKPADTVVFTSMSKKYFYMRLFVTKFALEQGAVPISPFASFDYFCSTRWSAIRYGAPIIRWWRALMSCGYLAILLMVYGWK
jgi:hypothetical protein